jgi:predicted transposase YbfD/YdcC
VGTLPVAGKEKEEVKRTNEIKTAIPLLEAMAIEGKEVSADALLTHRELADYLVTKRKAHYHFTVKGNQPGVLNGPVTAVDLQNPLRAGLLGGPTGDAVGDEDRSRIRTGHGPENITRLRRFAISVIKSKGSRSVAQKMRQLTRNVRLVFDYLRMTENSCASHSG